MRVVLGPRPIARRRTEAGLSFPRLPGYQNSRPAGKRGNVPSYPRAVGLRMAEPDRRQAVGVGQGIGEDPGPLLGEVDPGPNRERGAVVSRGELVHDLAIVDRQGDRPRMGHQGGGWDW